VPERLGDAARATAAGPPEPTLGQDSVHRVMQRPGQVLVAPRPPAGEAGYYLWPSPDTGPAFVTLGNYPATVQQLGPTFHN